MAQFPKQTSLIEKVQPLLEEMSSPDPAALMPPNTIVYIETGSPGRQIETILKILKGTPFENPLAAIVGGQKLPGEKTPGDVLAALLNPSMMAEFKKIRGMAVGVSSLQGNIPGVVVLYPGKSDALRGILLAGLGMAGQPDEPIEGMRTMLIGGGAGAAYDDNVIIIAQPLERLSWCIKQYKGVTDEPSLLSENKAFSRISRKRRQDSALTIWLDGAGAYSAIAEHMARSRQAEQLRLINGVVDFESIEEVIAHLFIGESSIGVEANVGFKEGHHCLAYDLIRTPNLSRGGFEAVPPQTIGLASLALGQPGSGLAGKAQERIKKLTGLDIGREIFANIEQITVFAVPPSPGTNKNALSKHISPALPCVGLAVTSHNPQQTHRLIAELFTVTELMTNASSGEQGSQQVNPAGDKYRVGLINNQAIYCYMGQAGKSTIVTLSPEVLRASMSAIKKRKSILTAGLLRENLLRRLSHGTSKLALVNVGGAIRIADAHVHRAVDTSQQRKLPVSELLGQLAQSCEQSSVQLHTSEELNSFGLQCSIDEMPPLGKVFRLLMQLPRPMPENLTSSAIRPQPADGAMASAVSKPELRWVPGMNAAGHKVYFGSKSDKLSLLAEVTSARYAELPGLEMDATYYWRVDEVQADGSVVTGDVWSFTTGKLIGWWKLDEMSGTTAADSSGNGNDGRLVGDPQWQPVGGRIDGALDFDGDGDYVKLPEMASGLNAVTVAMWVYMNEEPLHGTTILNQGKVEPGLFAIKVYNAGNLSGPPPMVWFHTFTGGVDVKNYGGNISGEIGKWMHVAVTYDENIAKIYVNGEEVISKAVRNHYPVSVGLAKIRADLNAKIDDVRIYNYALSQAEVSAVYKNTPNATGPEPAGGATVSAVGKLELRWVPGMGATKHKVYFSSKSDELSLLAEVTSPSYAELPRLETDATYYWRVDEVQADGSIITGDVWSFSTGKLIGWWKFDEVSGTNAADSSGKGNDGVLVGDPQWQPSAGKVGGALEFDGVGDYVKLPKMASWLDAVTVTMWVYMNEEPLHGTTIFAQDAWRPGIFAVRVYNAANRWGPPPMVWFNTFVGGVDIKNYGGDISGEIGKWMHVAVTYDENIAKIYVNGRKVVSKRVNNHYPVSVGPAKIGSGLNARMDDVRIYNCALSQTEVISIYKGSSPALAEKAKTE